MLVQKTLDQFFFWKKLLTTFIIFWQSFLGEIFDVAGFEYEEDEYGDFEGNKTTSSTSTKTTEKSKPKPLAPAPKAKPRQDVRPKRLVFLLYPTSFEKFLL